MGMQRAAQALIIGGMISLAVGLVISLLIGYVIRDESIDSTAGLLTVSIGTNVAGVIFGVSFPLTILGIVLAWVSRPEAEAAEWEEDEDVEAGEGS